MRALFSRWRRVAAELFRIGSQIRSIAMRLFGVAVAWVGIGALSGFVFGWGRVLRWIIAEDWSHAAFLVASSLLALALLALYGHEKEKDELALGRLRVAIELFKPVVLPVYEYSQANIFKDVLSIRFRFVFENHSGSNMTPRISKIALQVKGRWGWKPLPHALGAGCSPYIIASYRVPSHEVTYEQFDFHTLLPGGASSYLHRLMRLIVELRAPGQHDPKQVIDFTPEPIVSSADPASTTAPEQSPPSSPESSGSRSASK
jgi:hypothetical protein